MRTTKEQLLLSLKLLKDMCPSEDFDLDWMMGQPRLVRCNESVDVSIRGTKAEVQRYIRMVIAGVEAARRQSRHLYLAQRRCESN
jgi:hypothetical protein